MPGAQPSPEVTGTRRIPCWELVSGCRFPSSGACLHQTAESYLSACSDIIEPKLTRRWQPRGVSLSSSCCCPFSTQPTRAICLRMRVTDLWVLEGATWQDFCVSVAKKEVCEVTFPAGIFSSAKKVAYKLPVTQALWAVGFGRLATDAAGEDALVLLWQSLTGFEGKYEGFMWLSMS